MLVENKILTNLDLRGNMLGDQGIYQVSQGLLANTSVELLNLSCNEMTAFGADFLTQTFLNHQDCPIKYLDISYNPLGNGGITFIANYLEITDKHFLTKLNVTSCNFTAKGATRFFTGLRNQKMDELICDKNDLSDKYIHSNLTQGIIMGQVRKIHLNSCNLKRYGAMALSDAVIKP